MPTSLGKNNGQHFFVHFRKGPLVNCFVKLYLNFENTVLNLSLSSRRDYEDLTKKEKVTKALRISQFPVDKD